MGVWEFQKKLYKTIIGDYIQTIVLVHQETNRLIRICMWYIECRYMRVEMTHTQAMLRQTL